MRISFTVYEVYGRRQFIEYHCVRKEWIEFLFCLVVDSPPPSSHSSLGSGKVSYGSRDIRPITVLGRLVANQTLLGLDAISCPVPLIAVVRFPATDTGIFAGNSVRLDLDVVGRDSERLRQLPKLVRHGQLCKIESMARHGMHGTLPTATCRTQTERRQSFYVKLEKW